MPRERNREMSNFRNKLADLINSESLENNSNTPDFILANYLGKVWSYLMKLFLIGNVGMDIIMSLEALKLLR